VSIEKMLEFMLKYCCRDVTMDETTKKVKLKRLTLYLKNPDEISPTRSSVTLKICLEVAKHFQHANTSRALMTGT